MFGRGSQVKPEQVNVGGLKYVTGGWVSPPLVNQSRETGVAHRPPTLGLAWAALNISASAVSTLA